MANFLSTRPSYTADWGDYVSFAEHLHRKADNDGTDLLLIDTGDRIEGNGLYDASEPKGKYTFDIIKQQNIDLICIGNHELYKANSSQNELEKTVPNFSDAYLASNVDILNPATNELQPLAPRFKKFVTKNQGIRILAFGFIFDFHRNANNTVIQDVEETVKEDWFRSAIADREVDLIVVIGHASLRSAEYDLLFQTIRSEQWDTPIQFFGGHTHIRDYKVYDKMSTGIESGRYGETIGFASIQNLKAEKSQSITSKPKFSRRYIDNNLYSLFRHSGRDIFTFGTPLGNNVTEQITVARKALKLDLTLGCAPYDLWMDRRPYPDNQSIFTWLEEKVLPTEIRDKERSDKPALVFSNTGAIRYDIRKGPFTRDSTYLVSPFTSGFRAMYDVPMKAAKKVLDLLNHEGPVLDEIGERRGLWDGLRSPEQYASTLRKDSQYDMALPQVQQGAGTQAVLGIHKDPELVPGYTTKDDAGDDGDDTVHEPIPFYKVPNCIQIPINYDAGSPPETVDIVYNEFIQPWILLALNYLGVDATDNSTTVYMEGQTLTSVMSDWIESNWKCDG